MLGDLVVQRHRTRPVDRQRRHPLAHAPTLLLTRARAIINAMT
jgi:hypothetical protein